MLEALARRKRASGIDPGVTKDKME
jgi:hypothetical protein